MDDLIYSFLLQSDYPRASVIFDKDLLGLAAQAANGMKAPSFVIVDPDTADILAVIDVVGAVDGDGLRQVAIETGAYASRLGGKSIQGFVIRVDVRGNTEAEQVQFYRIWPNSTLQQLTTKTFPDLETLRVARKLRDSSQKASVSVPVSAPEPVEAKITQPEPVLLLGKWIYLPALVLLLMLVVDGYISASRGGPFMSVSQSVLAFGAALLFTLPAVLRRFRG